MQTNCILSAPISIHLLAKTSVRNTIASYEYQKNEHRFGVWNKKKQKKIIHLSELNKSVCVSVFVFFFLFR